MNNHFKDVIRRLNEYDISKLLPEEQEQLDNLLWHMDRFMVVLNKYEPLTTYTRPVMIDDILIYMESL